MMMATKGGAGEKGEEYGGASFEIRGAAKEKRIRGCLQSEGLPCDRERDRAAKRIEITPRSGESIQSRDDNSSTTLRSISSSPMAPSRRNSAAIRRRRRHGDGELSKAPVSRRTTDAPQYRDVVRESPSTASRVET